METFLTTILIIFVGFWLLGLVGRVFLRWWIAKKQREFQQQFGGDGNTSGGSFGNGSFRGFYTSFGGGARQRETQRQREGEVTVTEKTVRSEYQVGKEVGDYVEYEEMHPTQNTEIPEQR